MKRILFGAMGVATLALSSAASAAIIDFEDIVSDQFGDPIPSQGFNFDFEAQGWALATNGYTGFNRLQNGTSTLFQAGGINGNNSLVNFKPLDDSPFSAQGFDSAVFDGTQPVGVIEVIGNYEGGGTTSQTFTIINQWQSFALNGTFTNLDSITVIDQFGGNFGTSPGFQLDNITVNDVVPEPASMAVLGLGALALIRRRRTSN